MLMTGAAKIAALLFALLLGGAVCAQDGERASIPYFQSKSFNVPSLDGWEDQSAGGVAQFYLAGAQATIRSATLATDDAIAAAEADLMALTGSQAQQPIYRGKVNLADGTWTVLVYTLDEATRASVMARPAGEGSVVISFVERDPATVTTLLTLPQADDSLESASAEIAIAAETLSGIKLSDLAEVERLNLPSGEWVVYAGDGISAMGLVFGNDSYIALQEGAPGELAALAEAYNRTLLGFFITPDNSPYLALGLAVVMVILGALVGSLFWRERSLRKDLALLELLAQEKE